MPKWSPQINHLSYADDTIIFCSGDNKSLKKMMRILKRYERSSGQMINSEKSYFYLHHKTENHIANRIQNTLGMTKGCFPFTYLGCPIFYGRRKIAYFEDLVKKITNRVQSWQNRLLSLVVDIF